MEEPTAGTAQVRVLIADNAELVRRGIRDVLARDGRFSVVGEIARPVDAAEAWLELAPDITFLGLGRDSEGYREGSTGLTALQQTLRSDPSACVIVLVNEDTAEDVLAPVRAGARGVLLRDASATTLLEATRDVLAGGATLDPRLARSLFDHLAFGAGPSLSSEQEHALDPAVLGLLSRREQEVLRALARGYRNKEIGAELGVSVGTVKTHLRHIFRKLKVADRTAAVLAALQVRLPKAA